MWCIMPLRMDEYRHRELHPIFQMNLANVDSKANAATE
ncbi:Uncharacterized protein AC502_3576 [Pseudomonas syringae pv. maculicola]|nr:Uncharacterized protein AC502_3576 [Pseudomonas syringae pv. maculicola]